MIQNIKVFLPIADKESVLFFYGRTDSIFSFLKFIAHLPMKQLTEKV